VVKRRAQGVYALDHVEPVAQAPGRARRATVQDRDLLAAWWRAFDVEALGRSRSDEQIERAIEHGLEADDAGVVLWEDGGRPVSLAGFGGPTPNGIRIGPVYTPPEHRSRGYASSLVATLSAERLASGRRYCYLYTDLANPVSNRIYERIGYRRTCESAEIDFG
jgi:predicted GNAT family acetyltransferase